MLTLPAWARRKLTRLQLSLSLLQSSLRHIAGFGFQTCRTSSLIVCAGILQAALQAFKNGTAQVLVATDVAGRGLHIRNLPYIVNYDFPSRMEAYIHRVGRTGRLASSGHAFSFFTRNLAPLARPLLGHLLVLLFVTL